MEEVLFATGRAHGAGVPDAVEKLLDLPHQVLARRGPRREHAARVKRALERYEHDSEDSEPDTEDDAQGPAPPQPQQPPLRNLKQQVRKGLTMHRHLADGNVSKAAHCLNQHEAVTCTPTMRDTLLGLHPAEPPPELQQTEVTPLTVSADTLTSVLKALKKGKAGGPSGWTYAHVRAACTRTKSARSALLRLVNVMLAGTLPHVQLLSDSRLIAVGKPDGGVRPIAIAEVFVRIACLCALSAATVASLALPPLQLGVGVRGGAECIGHALRAALHDDPATAVVQLDFTNAFNSVSRQAVLHAVKQRQPALLPFVQWLYGRHSRLLLHSRDEPLEPITSQSGVRQGDPLGTLLFALTLQGPLEHTQQLHPNARFLALHDDVHVHGKPSELAAGVAALRERAQSIGLRLRLSKCAVYSPTPAVGAETARLIGIPHAEEGIVAAGSPVGSPAFVRQTVQTAADKVLADLDELAALQVSAALPTQDAFYILRASLVHRLGYLTRVCPVLPSVGDVDGLLERAETSIARQQGLAAAMPREDGDISLVQAQLPLRHGGLGLRIHTPLERKAARLASAALTHAALSAGPACFDPFRGDSGTHLQAVWEEVRAAAPDDFADSPADLPTALRRGHPADAQRKCSRAVAQQQYDALLERVRATYPPEKARVHASRLRSVACQPASAWLTALPSAPSVTISSPDFAAALQRRLGISCLPAGAPDVSCFCGTQLSAADSEHDHFCRIPTELRTNRHDHIVEVVRRACRRAGYSTTREPLLRALQRRAASAGERARQRSAPQDARGDLLVTLDQRMHVGDVSIIHPACSTYRAKAAEEDGHAANLRDEQKQAKYDKYGDKAYSFVPLSIETYGRLGGPFMKFITRLGRKAAARSEGMFTCPQFVSSVLQELSVSLNEDNAAIERAVSSFFVRVSGEDYLSGLTRPCADPGSGSE